jgi:NAD(P)-dependent dehydrogenase (short-subunit alcohol dehydrogenase family)
MLERRAFYQQGGFMKSVLITGCSSGFGMLAAVTAAKNGFRVFATMRNLGKRQRLDAALAKAGVTAEVLALDVTSAESIEAAVRAMLEKAGRIDALVNNAGGAIGGFVEDVSLDEYRRQFDTNFFGLVAMTKAVLPHMRRQRSGRIVNLSSIGGRVGNPGLSAYAASKFAVEGFSESLALEADLFGVRVVLIEPGTFKTEIFESNKGMAAGTKNPASPYFAATQALEKKVDELVARHGADPQQVADAILHALTTARPKLRYLVGTDAKLQAAIHALGGFPVQNWVTGKLLGFSEIRPLIVDPVDPLRQTS